MNRRQMLLGCLAAVLPRPVCRATPPAAPPRPVLVYARPAVLDANWDVLAAHAAAVADRLNSLRSSVLAEVF